MANKIFHSSTVTFLDRTDERKLEVYIASNHPTVQIKNQNTNEYTPNWSTTNLQLSADVYIDSQDVTFDTTQTSINWYTKIGNTETHVGSGSSLTIKTNVLATNPIITYICRVTYQNVDALSQITFTRVDTGTDGADGTSVKIKGTATSVTAIPETDYYTITYEGGDISNAELNDSYMYNGDLYVCVDSKDGVDYFINVGRIQGPKGEDAKNIVLSGSSQVFKISKTNILTPATITVTATPINTVVSKWLYRINSTMTWTELTNGTTALGGMTRNGNIVTITGANLTSTVTSITLKATDDTVEDVLTIYKAFDGIDGGMGAPASMAFLTNENISFGANANGQVALTTFTTNVVAYSGTTKVAPTIGTITGLPSGMTVAVPITKANEQILTFSIANNSNLGSASSNNGTITIPVTSPVSTNLILSWSKINTGATGVGIESTTVSYGVSDSSSSQPTDWQSTIPAVAEGKYLWTRTIIDYTDEKIPDTVTYVYAKQGAKGDTGNPGNSVTVSSIQYQEGASATTAPTGTWSNSVVAVADGRYLWSKTVFSDGKVAYGVAKQGEKGNTGDPGRGISSIVEQYYHSTSATSQTGGSWATTAPTWVDGKYIWTRSVITYTDTTTHTTTPICVTGQKGGTGGTGAPGTGVESVDIWYYQSTSATTLSGGSWSTTAPTWSDGKYVWTKTITTYTDKTTDETSAVCLTGQRGATGVGIKSVTEKYLATASSSGVTISTTGWTDAIQTITATNKYLWNYEIITYTNDATTTTTPVIIGVFGNTGGTGPQGKGIKSITEYYLATASASGVTTSTTGWTTTIQTISATNKYLWNYELITYTDNTTATITPVVIGVYGDKGEQGNPGSDAYTVLLTNESHVFAGNITNALAGEASTQVVAYLKTAAQSVTVVSVNGVAATTTATNTGITGLTFQCNALTSTSPTITFKCTTAFVSPSGTIPIKLKVGNIEFTKVFTYSIAFKGSTGTPSSSYWLVSNASAVQKTSNGDVLFTPATLTFTGKVKTGSGAPSDYAGRWILAYSTDGTTYTDAYTSAANEATASIAASDTYKAVRARMYLAGGTTTLLDEQIIPFVSDGEIGPIGPTGDDAVTFQIYSSNGYALSTSVPTITLQTFAYIGDVEITAGATFQWYRHNGTDWVAISGATSSYLNVSRDDVSFSNNYRCIMQFNNTEYVGVVTIDDKNDENRVFASKPTAYFAGDLWIVGTDYIPSNFTLGAMLRAEHTNSSYTDSDWVAATKYDDEIDRLTKTVGAYEQYFSVDSTNGLKVGDASINDNLLKVDRIETTSVNAREVKVESPLTVTGKYSGSTMLQAPILNLGNFSLVIESNGSLSVVANT